MPRLWAEAVHAHSQNVEGLLYASRQLNNRKAADVFEREKAKLTGATYQLLGTSKSLRSVRSTLHIDYTAP